MKRSALLYKTLRIIGIAGFPFRNRFLAAVGILWLIIAAAPAALAGQYWQDTKQDMKRGIENILTFPLEIPLGIQKYHERAGLPYVRQTKGFFVGIVRSLHRFSSGIADLLGSPLPGSQQCIPITPVELL